MSTIQRLDAPSRKREIASLAMDLYQDRISLDAARRSIQRVRGWVREERGPLDRGLAVGFLRDYRGCRNRYRADIARISATLATLLFDAGYDVGDKVSIDSSVYRIDEEAVVYLGECDEVDDEPSRRDELAERRHEYALAIQTA